MEKEPIALRDVIKEVTRDHLQNKNGLVMGQCLTAVGWVGGTLPEIYEEGGMVELSMADVAGGGFAVGAALAGRRPMYVIRYQGFNWFNAAMVINYACKSKEIWGRPCPMFVRSIAMEGSIGPVAGSSHHALYYRMPGVKIYSPMTPEEFKVTYREFMAEDSVFYVSEHRGAFPNSEELPDVVFSEPDYVLCPISITRFAAIEASKVLLKEGIKVAVHHIFRVKPFCPTGDMIKSLRHSRRGGCVLDDDYPEGVAKTIGFDLASSSGASMSALGLPNKTAGFSRSVDNLPPDADSIIEFIKKKIV
jgi:acetoin:2,6-dichlorophenolindophenol oxidoreductase subunit beta